MAGQAPVIGNSKNFKSFADVIKGIPSDNTKEKKLAGFPDSSVLFCDSSEDIFLNSDSVGNFLVTRKDDKPAISLSDDEVRDLSQPFQLTLIGKFLAGRPKWDLVQSVFKAQKLKGEIRCFNLDIRHFVIYLNHFEDYIKLFARQRMLIHGFPLKIFKWTPEFSVDAESSIVPVWILLPMLKLHLFNRSLLFSIAAIYGNPLKLDFATSKCLRPGCARVLVELDLRKHHEKEIWIGSDESRYMQQVLFQNLPGFCLHCRKIGHSDSSCFHLDPELNLFQTKVGKKDLQNSVIKNSGTSLIQKHSVGQQSEVIQSECLQDRLLTSDMDTVLSESDVHLGMNLNELQSVDTVLSEIDHGKQLFCDVLVNAEQQQFPPIDVNHLQAVEDLKMSDSVNCLQQMHQLTPCVAENSEVCHLTPCVAKNSEARHLTPCVADGSSVLLESDFISDDQNKQLAVVGDVLGNDNLVINCLIDNQSEIGVQKYVFVREVILQSGFKNQSNIKGQMQIDSALHIVNNNDECLRQHLYSRSDRNIDGTVNVLNQKTKERNSWADEVEEQMMLNNITLGEQISKTEDVLQIHKVKEKMLSNEVDYGLGPNFQEFDKKFCLKVSPKSLGDEVDSEGEDGLYQILQDKGKLYGKETSFRSPIMTRSYTKGKYMQDGYVSDSWYITGIAF